MPAAKTSASKKAAARKTTTTTRVRKPSVIDLDGSLDLDLVDEEEVATKQIKIFGEEFTLYVDVNSYLLTASLSDDADAIVEMFKSLFPEDDYRRFIKAMGRQRGMDAANMAKIFGGLLEVASDRPT